MVRTKLWVGLDVGADEMAVCGTDNQGKILFEHLIPATAAALNARLKSMKQRVELIGLESGSCAIVLTRSLRELGYPVAVFDARQASKFLAIRQNKTDRNDARGLADIARVGRASVSQVRVKSPECQRLRSMLVMRQKLVRLRTTTEGAMRSLFRLNGGKLRTCSSAAAMKRNAAAELQQLRKLQNIDLSEDIEPLLALSEAIRIYVEGLDRKLSRMAEAHPVCRRFLDISGVGTLCALTFYSVVEDPTRFKRNSDVGPYLGMVPLVRQSGQLSSKRRISKRGDSLTRSYLVNAALTHIRYGKSSLSTWGERLIERTGPRQAHIAVARKLAVTMLAIWKSGEPFDPQRICRPNNGNRVTKACLMS